MNMTYAYAKEVLTKHSIMSQVSKTVIETNELKLARKLVASGKSWPPKKKHTRKTIDIKPPRNRGRAPMPIKGKIITADAEVFLVASVVCEDMAIELDKIFERTREQTIRGARQIVHYITKTLWPNYAYRVIGVSTGGLDHSTVMHSCEVIENEMSLKRATKEKIENYIEMVKAKMSA
jgi:hypothetical protein